MWLIVCAPVISHLVRAADADEPFAAICSIAQPGGAFAPGQPPQQNPVHASHAGHQDAAGDQLSDCGYCNLLADHIALPGIGPVTRVVIGSAIVAVGFVPPEQFWSRTDYPRGRPRGPPASPRISS
jgi:hypothetical protein